MQLYKHFYSTILNGAAPAQNPVRVALLRATYTFNDAHTSFNQCASHETAGTGYVQNGEIIPLSVDVGTTETKLMATDVAWTNATISAKFAVIYVDATINGVEKPLLSCMQLGETEVASSNMDFTLKMPAGGLFVFAM